MAEKQTTEPRFYTPQEFAELLRVHDRTVRRALNDGEIPGAIRIGRQWRIPASALERMAATGEQSVELAEFSGENGREA